MKKSMTVLGVLMAMGSMQAMAYDAPENSAYTGVKLSRVSLGGLENLGYGVRVGMETRIGENHRIRNEASYNDSRDKEQNGVKIRTQRFGGKSEYAYGIPLNEGKVVIAPKAALGLERITVKGKNSMVSLGGKADIDRLYAETGVEAAFHIDNGWSVSPSATVQYDLHAKAKGGGTSAKLKNSFGYKVEVGVGKELESGGKLTVAPYHEEWRIKSAGKSHKALEESGLAVEYSFE